MLLENTVIQLLSRPSPSLPKLYFHNNHATALYITPHSTHTGKKKKKEIA